MTEAAASAWRGPWARLAAAALAVLLLGPQPNVPALTQLFARAANASQAGDLESAADALSAAAARLPYDGGTIYQAGLAELSAGRYPQALDHLRQSADLQGWTAVRRVALGDAYQGQGDPAAALAQWELALEDLPEDPAVLARLANGYEAAGRYPEARVMLQRLVDLRVADPGPYYRLALLSAALDPRAAADILTLAGSLAPTAIPLTQALLEAIQSGLIAGDEAYLAASVGYTFIQFKEYALAREALHRALAFNPDYPDAHAYLGLARDLLGEDGAVDYERAIALAPEAPLPRFFLGLHFRRLGQSRQALPHLQAAQKLDPQNPAIAAEIGGAYAALSDLANAEIAFNLSVQLAPRQAEFWILLARFYLENNYRVEDPGLPAARQAASLAPDDPNAQDVLGHALLLTGDLTGAQSALEKAVVLGPDLPAPYYHLGVLYAALGQLREARAALEHAVALDPQGPTGDAALTALIQLGP